MKRIILGGLLGGVVLFVWGAISHMALPLGTVGLRSIPPALEPAVLGAMQSGMTERALYFFPGLDLSRKMTDEEQQAWNLKYQAGPAGIVAFDPHPGDRVSLPAQLGTELLCNVLAGLMGALVVFHLPAALGYGKRVLLVGALGLIVFLDVDASYWNWYGFPTSYALVQLVDHTVAWLLAGLVLARICRQ
jgi:hypothetical protein